MFLLKHLEDFRADDNVILTLKIELELRGLDLLVEIVDVYVILLEIGIYLFVVFDLSVQFPSHVSSPHFLNCDGCSHLYPTS